MEPEFTFVDSPAALKELVDHLGPVDRIALDTEADNLHHYETRVCLMQISAADRHFLIDTLTGMDLQPLLAALTPKLLVMHGSDYDLRLLREMAQFEPREVFDTMLAAQLLGHDRIGLSSLLKDFLNADHPKDSQKADWSRRPLPPKMLNYAVRDVIHLVDLMTVLEERLEAAGRMEWHRQKCAWQIETAASGFPRSDENAWRVGQTRRWPPSALAALYELWHWRESEARRLDRPPFKVMSNDYLTRLSLAVADGSHRELYKTLPHGFRQGRVRGLAVAMEKGAKRDPKTLPRRTNRHERPQPLTGEELARQESIKGCRDKVAKDLGIDATLIASRAQIAQLARNPGEAEQVLLPWQVNLLRPTIAAPV